MLSITELNLKLQASLEKLQTIPFYGEITQITVANSGHAYLTIKDPNHPDHNEISCVMFREDFRQIDFAVSAGLDVEAVGIPTVYVKTARLQIRLRKLTLAGDGLLAKKFKELKEKLTKEGYFAPDRKRSLPRFPKTIGVVTSNKGAVLHDIVNRLTMRWPLVRVLVSDTRVQGKDVHLEIINALEALYEIKPNIIIIARGGGSLQDLAAFNEEDLVKAIFRSPVPVISAIGHETDNLLSDMVADVRASTPTAAAELATPDITEIRERIHRFTRMTPEMYLEPYFEYLNNSTERLRIGALRSVDNLRNRLAISVFKSPSKLADFILYRKQQIKHLQERSDANCVASLTSTKHILEKLTLKFKLLSHENTLDRGYSFVTDDAGIPVTDLPPRDARLLIESRSGRYRARTE